MMGIKKIESFLEQYDFCRINEYKNNKLIDTYELECLSIWYDKSNNTAGIIDINEDIYNKPDSILNGFIMNETDINIKKNIFLLEFNTLKTEVIGIN